MNALLALVGLACGRPPPTDQDHFLAALTAPAAEMAAHCDQIDAPALRGECLAQAAGALAPGGIEEAMALCDGVEDGVWRDECAFMAVDGAGLVGNAAVAACRRARHFGERCLQHAVNRSLDALELPEELGAEPALRQAAREVVEAHYPSFAKEHLQQLIDAAMARLVARRWTSGRPFDPQSCGEASERVCELSYESVAYRAIEHGRLGEICAGDLSAAGVAAAGGPGWTGDGAIPVAYWANACEER